jgi:purine catabolism regulator
MSVTVREVLSLDIVQAGQPEVVAGEANLDRPIRWVHIADVIDVAPLLKGSELLLTSGLELSHSPERHRGYLRDLAAAGVAGVFMSLGWAYRRTPAALVDEARRLELPLVLLHRPIPFVEVTEQVHTAILNQQFALTQKAERIGRSFTDLVLHGSGLRSVVDALGRVVGKPVVLETVAHHVVAYTDPPGTSGDLLDNWNEHVVTGHEATADPLAVEAAETGCVWTVIPLRQDVWGRLHVVVAGEGFDEMDRLALDRAAIAIALLLLSQRYEDAVLDQAGADLIADLVRGAAFADEDVVARARGLGCELRDRRLAVMAVDADGFAAHIRRQGLEEEEVQATKLAMLDVVRRVLGDTGCESLTAVDSDEVLAVVAMPKRSDPQSVMEDAGRRIRERLPSRTGGLTATVGVSREVRSVLGLTHAFGEAREAVAYGKSARAAGTNGEVGGVHHFERLGLDTLILRLRDSAELSTFVDAELGPILAHDARRNPKLLPTVEAYLAHGGNKSATAKAIHLERRSLYHRLEKIGDLLGRDLDDPETRTRLHVAVKALRLQRRGGAVEP